MSGGGEIAAGFLDGPSLSPRLSFYHQTGETTGLSDDFTRLSSFVPVSFPSSDRVWFADLQSSFLRDGILGGSFGLGTRSFSETADLVYGMHLYYDYRDSGINGFQQISPGFELLGPNWESRFNVYLPRLFSDRQLRPNQFRGNFLFTDRFETALSGFDLEYGSALPLLEQFQPWAYAGLYHFQGPERDSFWGVKGRLAAQLSNSVSLSLAVQNDRLFDTTVNFGVEVRLTGGSLLKKRPWAAMKDEFRRPASSRSPETRLLAATHRSSQVVLDQTEEALAIDPATGQPLMFLHVAAGGNSTGAFDDPYATLKDAIEDPRFVNGEIRNIYVRRAAAQTTTLSESLTLLDGAQILSSGPVQLVETQTGLRVLPLSGSDLQSSALPVIAGDVTMADDSRLSGFEIQPTGDGITASGIARFSIDSNVVVQAPGNGIRLSNINSTDAVMVMNNQIDDSMQSGILLESSSGFSGMLMNNQISDSGRHAIEIRDSTFNGMIQGNRLVTSATDGLNIDRTIFDGMITENTIDQNTQTGVEIRASDFSGEISRNTIAGTFQGTLSAAEASRIFTVDSQGNVTINSAPDQQGNSGIFLFGTAADADVQIANNVISNFPYSGVNVQIPKLFDAVVPEAFFRGSIANNQFNQSIFGVLLFDSDDVLTTGGNVVDNTFRESLFGVNVSFFATNSLFTGNIERNTFINTDRQSIDVRADNFTGNVSGNIVTFTGDLADSNVNAGTTGIEINLGLFRTGTFTFRGDISGNQVSGVESFTINPDTDPFEIVGDGIAFSGTDFIGNVENNVVTDNKGIGLAVSAFQNFTGNIIGNRAERNGLRADGERGMTFFTRNFNGAVERNIANNNNGSGMQINFVSWNGRVADNIANDNQSFGITADIDGTVDILRNTTNGNQSSGMRLDIKGTNSGQIAGNTSIGNGNAGIRAFLIPFSSPVFTTTTVTNNVTQNNGGNGIEFTPFTSGELRVSGNFTNNTSSGNGEHGLVLGSSFTGLTRYTGSISDNTFADNGQQELEIRIEGSATDGSDDSVFSVLNNTLTDSTSGSVLFVENNGASDLTLTLDGNMASPILTDLNNSPFNFDLTKPGTGGFTVLPADVQTRNTGSVGSSASGAALVTIP